MCSIFLIYPGNVARTPSKIFEARLLYRKIDVSSLCALVFSYVEFFPE